MTEAELSRLYAEYGYVLFRRCLAYLGEEATAQDAVQEVFVRALGEAERLRAEPDARLSLCRIADALCVDRLRRRRRGRRDSSVSSDPPRSQRVVDPILDDDRESFLAIQRLLANLDPGDRRLAVLYYLDEYTPAEIAAELRLSRAAADRRLRALEEQARALLMQERSA